MKTNRMKRWIGMLLAICLVMGFSNFPLTVLAANDLTSGETLDELPQDETMQTNNGTITTNNGTVKTNDYDATVETNNGTVTDNFGAVKTNYGTVTDSHITVNINNGTVNRNRGTVETNYYDAMVETNNGTVTENYGTVTDNFYSVKTNRGTVTTNYYNATVESNHGTVTTNVIGGTVTDNYGTVETNNGMVVNNYGGTVGGTSAINNYYKLTYDADSVTVSGLTVKNGNSYILSTASVTLAPPSGQHFMSVEITPEGATLTENDNGTYTLSGVTENIELTVATANHSYGTWQSNGDGTHTRTCSVNCGHTEKENCSGGTATCTKKAICSVCGDEYGELADHSYGTEWKSDGTNHWRECSCGAKTEAAAHSGGTATCKDKAVCSVCSTAYGELAVHTYKDGKCTVCGAADPNYKPPATDNPQTGDNSNMALWIALLLLSGGAVMVLTVYDRKRRTAANK